MVTDGGGVAAATDVEVCAADVDVPLFTTVGPDPVDGAAAPVVGTFAADGEVVVATLAVAAPLPCAFAVAVAVAFADFLAEDSGEEPDLAEGLADFVLAPGLAVTIFVTDRFSGTAAGFFAADAICATVGCGSDPRSTCGTSAVTVVPAPPAVVVVPVVVSVVPVVPTVDPPATSD